MKRIILLLSITFMLVACRIDAEAIFQSEGDVDRSNYEARIWTIVMTLKNI